jgi:hypothetical protein
MYLNNQQKEVLQILINKYESRSDYGEKNKHSRRTMIPINKTNFPLYYHNTEGKYRVSLNQDMIELKDRGFIQIEWERFSEGEELKKVYLNNEKVEETYKLLGVQSKIDKYECMLKLVNEFSKESNGVITPFYKYTLERLKNLMPLPNIIDIESIKNTATYLKGLNALLIERSDEITRRKWSIQLYNDSKKWEKIEPKILPVVRKYVYDDIEIDNKEILAEWGIIDNPQQILLFGPITFLNNYNILDFSKYNSSFGLDTKFIEDSVVSDLRVDSVVTVENLTSYYEYIEYITAHNFNHLVVYLGGFHNAIRRKLLTKIVDYSNKNKLEISFYHWGDIDLGGIRIWKHLSDNLNIKIDPIFMDVDTYNKHEIYGKAIETKAYISQLEKMLNEDSFCIFHEVIKLLIKNKKTVEQEIVLL